jgi:hypothetical protein
VRSRNPIVLGGALVAGFALIAGGGLSAVAANADSTSTKSAVAAFLPQFEGKLAKGQTLSAVPGSWAKAGTVSYQWLRDGKSIKGATAATYKIAKRDAKHSIALRAAVKTKAGTTTGTSVQRVISSIKHAVKAKAVTVTGEGKVGQTLAAKHAKWQGKKKAKATVRYQWTRDGFVIAGATHKTYQVTAADAGHDLSAVAKGKAKGLARAIRVSNTVAVEVPVVTPPAPTPGTPIYKDGKAPKSSADQFDVMTFAVDAPAWNNVKLGDDDLFKFQLFGPKAQDAAPGTAATPKDAPAGLKLLFTSNSCDAQAQADPGFCSVGELATRGMLTKDAKGGFDKLVVGADMLDREKAYMASLMNGDYVVRVTLKPTPQVKTTVPFDYDVAVKAGFKAITDKDDPANVDQVFQPNVHVKYALNDAQVYGPKGVALYAPMWKNNANPAQWIDLAAGDTVSVKITPRHYQGKAYTGGALITSDAKIGDASGAAVLGGKVGKQLKIYPYVGMNDIQREAFSKFVADDEFTLDLTVNAASFPTALTTSYDRVIVDVAQTDVAPLAVASTPGAGGAPGNDPDLWADPVTIPVAGQMPGADGLLQDVTPLFLPTWTDRDGKAIDIKGTDSSVSAKLYKGTDTTGTPLITFDSEKIAKLDASGITQWVNNANSSHRDRLVLMPYKGMSDKDKDAWRTLEGGDICTFVVTINTPAFPTAPIVHKIQVLAPIDQAGML